MQVRRNQHCQHCSRIIMSDGSTIKTVCNKCQAEGHSAFRSDCPICNKPIKPETAKLKKAA